MDKVGQKNFHGLLDKASKSVIDAVNDLPKVIVKLWEASPKRDRHLLTSKVLGYYFGMIYEIKKSCWVLFFQRTFLCRRLYIFSRNSLRK